MAIGIMVVWRMSGLFRPATRRGDRLHHQPHRGRVVAATERSELEATAASGILQITEATSVTAVLVLDGVTDAPLRQRATGSSATTSARTEAIDLSLAAAISGASPCTSST